jgi:spermidine/putrescine transport system permease protein
VKIYTAARASPTPAVNAAATVMLVSTLLAILVVWIIYRKVMGIRGEELRAIAEL